VGTPGSAPSRHALLRLPLLRRPTWIALLRQSTDPAASHPRRGRSGLTPWLIARAVAEPGDLPGRSGKIPSGDGSQAPKAQQSLALAQDCRWHEHCLTFGPMWLLKAGLVGLIYGWTLAIVAFIAFGLIVASRIRRESLSKRPQGRLPVMRESTKVLRPDWSAIPRWSPSRWFGRSPGSRTEFSRRAPRSGKRINRGKARSSRDTDGVARFSA